MASGLWSPIAVARIVATAVETTPGVVSLHTGALGEIATYGGGTRVPGVVVGRGERAAVDVHVVAAMGRPLNALADEIRDRVARRLNAELPAATAMPVHVHVADVSTEASGALTVTTP